MTSCQWELFRNTRAPIPSQKRQIALCQCTPCRNARLLFGAIIAKGVGINIKPRTAERLAVLEWEPEQPKETADDAG